MSSVINGNSVSIIKHFRDKAAALSVYWIYCARQNNEGVAWPSLRGLANDTGWSVQTVKDAREWLAEHGALERIKDYVRPVWRTTLSDKRPAFVLLDHAQYYRVTGILKIDGKSLPLLYENAHQGDFEDNAMPQDADVLPGGTSAASNIETPATELNTNKSVQLDSIDNPQASDTNDKAVCIGGDTPQAGELPQPEPPPQPLVTQPHIALIDAYWAGLPGGKPIGEDYTRHVRLASKAVGEVAPWQITTFMAELYAPATPVKAYQWWQHKVIPFEEVLKLLKPWLAEKQPADPTVPKPPRPIIVLPHAETLKERMARAEKKREEWAAGKAAREAQEKLRGR